ncbi:MAG: response regulator [Pseudanabaena sp.]|jgi:two-component system sensor histidine kinase/response regulator|uniref:hybrid sensor histidine kinase/response regulator n=1 Tax=Pseudanabaena mucicola TaxID=71190 RepID=UPI002577A46B|nr:hybrid sensor histidine kinase/response regulator [Pseudanabaena mucicola]MCA6585685.1 hybrid sensor histidine kinase/response regulator [Pseudanabaena sp. M051S1SP1A06QC]MCA6596907.1 hybrid sensor histidine kinase/response regulator [Pseudanabaena sp. M046S1SP1A06QC]MCA6606521.1 hybrid sensor histidine kinase/response regulator [Pseudanabaena sp. M007S1SP1A06QC]MCA6614799.1 hybrid sensor histidine kinase/response regulator [Pseudanabaena sp. M090S1SP1A06QC]MCA6623580.1 hybrid sensor histid
MKKYPAILIVDDEPNNFDVIEALLDNEGYDLNYASSGFKALERLEIFHPDVILLDVTMPELNGIDVCKKIKSNPLWRTIPIIMVTALTSKEDMAQCLDAGASDFLSKPVNGLELRARIKSMIRIKQQYEDLQSLLKMREDMVHMIVHDLRNPLSTILLSSELLSDPYLPESRRPEKIERINRSGYRLQSLIDSLLIMAKIESGKMVLEYMSADINQMCTSVIKDFEMIASQKKLKLSLNLPEGKLVNIDLPVFRRILDNLLSNAIKFSPSNSQITVSVNYPDDGGVSISVADMGVGISDSKKLVIFEKYEIGTPIQSTSQLGLGLAFCKLAIEAHGGNITVQENKPNGSIFTISIP